MQRHHGNPAQVDTSSRTVLDIAIGVLVGLRGCTPEEAFTELVHAVRSSGVGVGSLSAALIAVAAGTSTSSPEHAEAFATWGHLLDGATPRHRQPLTTGPCSP